MQHMAQIMLSATLDIKERVEKLLLYVLLGLRGIVEGKTVV